MSVLGPFYKMGVNLALNSTLLLKTLARPLTIPIPDNEIILLEMPSRPATLFDEICQNFRISCSSFELTNEEINAGRSSQLNAKLLVLKNSGLRAGIGTLTSAMPLQPWL